MLALRRHFLHTVNHCLAYTVDGRAESPLQDLTRDAFALADQSEQEVLGLNGDAAELAGLVPGKEENPSRPFRVAFEHPACLGVRGWR